MGQMTEVADLYVVLRAVGAKFEEGMAAAGASAGAADSKIAGVSRSVKMASLAMVGAGALVVVEAVKMSSEFDKAMEQLHTLAHVPQSSLAELSKGVLNVAGDVGFSPHSLAEALYHVESTFASVGITGPKAIGILTTAAKGAQIGGADLTDVVNALDAAVVSGIPGVKNIDQAMGALLATVGAGDMTMQNLADALGSGILAIAKQYGVTLADTGAALATFGDNNIRGAKAATDLRMVIMDLTKQAGPGQAALEAIGIAGGQLGKDMREGGLNKALLDLHHHLDAAGVKGTEVGKVLIDAFTKKSSAPLSILLGELDQFESKYPELKKGATSFGDSWAHTAALISTKAKEAKGNVEAVFIDLGHALTPIATGILNAFNGAFAWAKTHQETVHKIADVIKTVLVGALVIATVAFGEMAIEAAIAAAPFVLLALGIGLAVRAFMNLYEHNAKVREFVQTVVTAFKKDAVEALHWMAGAFQEAKKVVGEVIDALIGFYQHHKAAINQMLVDIGDVLKQIWQVFQAGFEAVKAIVTTVVGIVVDLWHRFGEHLVQHLVTAWNNIVQIVHGALDILKGVFEVITGILTGNWSKFWDGIENIVSGVWNIISGVVKAGINFVSTVIGAAMAGISAVWGMAWNTIESIAGSAWDGIKAVFAPVVAFFESIGNGITSAWNAVLKWFQALPGRLLALVKAAGTWLLHVGEDIIKGLLEGLKLETVGVFQWVVSQGGLLGLGVKMMKAVRDGATAAWDAVATFFKNMPGWILNLVKSAGTWLLNTGKSIMVGMWNGITAAASAVWSFLTRLPGQIQRLVAGAASWLYTTGKNVVTGLVRGVSANIGTLWDFLRGLPHTVYNILSGMYNWAFQVGKDMIYGIWDGIKAVYQWLKDKIKNFLSDIWGGMKHFLGIGSPSKLMRDTIGKHIVTGIALGIDENGHHVHNALRKLGTQVSRTRMNAGGFDLTVSGKAMANRGSGSLSGGHGTVGTGATVYYVTVQGQVIDTAGFFKAMQTASQQHGARNSSNGLAFTR